MKKNIFTLLALALTTITVAQDKSGFGIGTKRIDKAAMLDIQATNKGVLIPRIALSSDTHLLNGGKNPEGVIVYNIGKTLQTGFYYWDTTKWEKVSADSQVQEQITQINNEIKNITNIDGGKGDTDISYLVSYNPDSHVFTYLLPKQGGGYDQMKIDFNEAIKDTETNTFVREVTTTVEGKEVVSKYIYFSEKQITDWLKLPGNANKLPNTEMEDSLGTPIDVLGVVNNNFKEIFENTNNTEIINNIIKEAPNNVWIQEKGGIKYLVYKDENDKIIEVDLTPQETQTSIFKYSVTENGKEGVESKTDSLDVAKLESGDIYYAYNAEGGKVHYINMTSDIINSIEHNETLKKEIFKTVNNYHSTTGGNVYFGEVTGVNGDVLYTMDKDGNKTQIDISQDILKVIENTVNNSIVEKILEQTQVNILKDQHDVSINASIDNSKVYKGKRTVEVKHDDEYDVTFVGTIKVVPSKKVEKMENGNLTVTYEPTGEKMETLLSAKVINPKTKQVVVSTVTDVVVSGNEFTFSFGQNGMYMTLENGDYEVVFEYTASK